MNGREPVRRRVWRAVATGVAAGVATASLLGGCSTVRSNLGTSASACYLSLPAGSAAVHGAGRLAGVHLFTVDSLRRDIPRLFARLTIPRPAPPRICAFEFTGHFTAASVVAPLGSAEGRFAVVAVAPPANHVLGTVILEHPPYRFEHTHIG